MLKVAGMRSANVRRRVLMIGGNQTKGIACPKISGELASCCNDSRQASTLHILLYPPFNNSIMSRHTNPAPRTIFASRTTFDALAVDSGEDTDEEHNSDIEKEPEHQRFAATIQIKIKTQSHIPWISSSNQEQEPIKLTKSAIKKAQRLARLEQKQRQKQLKAQARNAEDSSDRDSTSKITNEATPEPSHEPPSSMSAAPEALADDPIPPKPSSPEVGQANGIAKPNAESLSKPIPRVEGIPPAKPDPVPVTDQSTVSRTVELPPANGSTAPDQSQPVEDPEKVKKRQNVLTRIIWTFIMIGGFIGTRLNNILNLQPNLFPQDCCCSATRI